MYKFGDKVLYKGKKAVITGMPREFRIEKRKYEQFAEIILEKGMFRMWTFVPLKDLKKGWQ